jgi:ABC-type multidrug transport system fused ATPase/permease subunit
MPRSRTFVRLKRALKMTNFPKTLLGFYFKFGFKPLWKILTGWFLLFVVYDLINSTWYPISQQKIIALFENQIPTGVDFVTYTAPTILLVIGIFLICNTMDGIQSTLSSRWRPKAQENISEALNDYIHHQSMNFFTGRIPGKMNSQINYIFGGFNLFWDFTTIVSTIGVILLNIGLILSINSYVAMLLGFAFMSRVIYSFAMVRPVNKASKKASQASSTLSGHIVDSISGFTIVKLFAGSANEKKWLLPLRKENIKRRIHSSFIQRLMWLIPAYLWDILFGAMLLVMVWLYSKGQIKISEIAFTLAAYQLIMGNIGHIARSIPNIMDVVGSAQQSYKELVKPIEVADVPNAPSLHVSRGAIEIRDVSFKYKRNQVNPDADKKDAKKSATRRGVKNVLEDFSLKIAPGEKVGLVGSSGAGKTTLVNLLMRFYDPTKGAIFIDGQDIHDVAQDSLRENIAFIPQEPTMFNRTLRDNIGYGRVGATDTQIRKAAKQAQADTFIMASEKQYDSLVGDRGIKLSGGQRQRIAIARAFLKDAPILILDEATSALDSETEAAIQKSFEELSKGRTTIAIAHRLSTLRNMDRIVVMDKGRIAEQGTHVQLLRKRGGIYARLWKMQSGGFLQE